MIKIDGKYKKMSPEREECQKRLQNPHNAEMELAKKELIDFSKMLLIEKSRNSSDKDLKRISNNMFDLYILCALRAYEDYRKEKKSLTEEKALLKKVDNKVDELLDLLTGVYYDNECSPGLHAITNHLIEYRDEKKEAKPREPYIETVISKRITSGLEHSAYLRGFVALLDEKIPLLKPLTKIKGPIAATVSAALDISDGSVSADTVKDYFKTL